MSAEAATVANVVRPPSRGETWRARVMFWLGFLFLMIFAGLIHRSQEKEVSEVELNFLRICVQVLWPVIALEVLIGVLRRDRSRPLRPVLRQALLVLLLPPYRMGLTDPRTGLIWFPRLGWQPRGKALYKALDRAFSGPMLLFAFLILPVLGLEYFRAEQVRNEPNLALALHIGVAVIWVAFALELILDTSSSPRPLVHLRDRWLDVAIVVLPMLEFILTKWVDAAPLARLLRLGRALSPEQIGRMQQLYRLRGMVGKAWQAFMLLGGLGRIIGDRPEKRLRRIEEQIANLEEQIAELKQQADEVRKTIVVPPCEEKPASECEEART